MSENLFDIVAKLDIKKVFKQRNNEYFVSDD
jgi:hypothetical protein